jgi:TRAP-type uncharacterized transport system substrate-binding protein
MSIRPARLALVLFGLAAVAGGAYAAHAVLLKTITVRIAVASASGRDALALRALAEALTASGRRTRLQIIAAGSTEKSLAMVTGRQAELASVRADAPMPSGVASYAVLYREAAILAAPSGSKIDSWRALKQRTLAVTGDTPPDDPLIVALLALHGASDAKRLALPADGLAEALRKNSVQAVAYVGPLAAVAGGAVPTARKAALAKRLQQIVGLDDAEQLAELDKRYEEAIVPAGALHSSPPLPAESVTTLAVQRHLIGRETAIAAIVYGMLRDMLEARRTAQRDFPELAQMGAPDLEKAAAVPVQADARAYFNGEERSLWDVLGDWIFIGPLLLGMLGTALVSIWRFVRAGGDDAFASEATQKLLAIGVAASRARTPEDKAALAADYDRLLDEIGPKIARAPPDPDSVAPLIAACEFAGRAVAGR